MLFVNDAQRRAVFASMNGCGFSDNLFARDPLKSFVKKMSPLLRDDVDVESVDWYAEYDSSLSEKENIVAMVKKLRERGMLKDLSERASYDPRIEIRQSVNDIITKHKNVDSFLDEYKDDKWAMSQFRNEMLRAVYSGMLPVDDVDVSELAAVDEVFNRYLNKIKESEYGNVRGKIKQDVVSIREAGVPAPEITYNIDVGKGAQVDFEPYAYELGAS